SEARRQRKRAKRDFGARSYDARQGQWLSADPVLATYMKGARGPVGRSALVESQVQFSRQQAREVWRSSHAAQSMRDIRGLREVEELIRANSERRSGVYHPASLSAYSLAQNNPTTFTDPDGNTPAAACAVVWVPGIGQAVCAGGLI